MYCDGEAMRLVIDRAKYPYIDPESFTLNATGQGCNEYTSDSTHVTSMIPLDRCGTAVSEYADLLTFYNSLNTEVKKTKSGITRHHAIEFKLECSYFRTSDLSLMAFNPIGRIVTEPTSKLICLLFFYSRSDKKGTAGVWIAPSPFVGWESAVVLTIFGRLESVELFHLLSDFGLFL